MSVDTVALQNQTTVSRAAAQNESTASKSTVNSKDFLFLLTQQLQYQDPMNPMDNSEMLAQEAQFATLEQMEALTSSFSQFSNIYQANSMLGQKVEVTVNGKSSTGVIDFVDYSDASGASVSVGGKLYPLDAVSKVYPSEANASSDSTTSEDKKFFKDAVNYIANGVASIYEKMAGSTTPAPVVDTQAPVEQQ